MTRLPMSRSRLTFIRLLSLSVFVWQSIFICMLACIARVHDIRVLTIVRAQISMHCVIVRAFLLMFLLYILWLIKSCSPVCYHPFDVRPESEASAL